MRILILGNSNIFQRKIFPALSQINNIKIELASKSHKLDKNIFDKTYNSYQTALNETSASLVYISLINSLHFNWALKSLKQNKNLIIDKPMTLKLSQTKKIINLASKKRLLITEAIVFDKHSQFKKMYSLLDLKKKTIINTKFHIPKLNKYLTKVKKVKDSKGLIDSFKIQVKSKNIILNSSFSFNSVYKNQIEIYNVNKKYSIDFAFSPPIDKKLQLGIFDEKKNKKYKITFKEQNAFLTYLNFVFNKLRVKKYDFFYKEIINIAKIKEKIS